MNRMACLQLTQRYADILISIQQEVQDAGGETGDELKGPDCQNRSLVTRRG
jgi:hypothetical protein